MKFQFRLSTWLFLFFVSTTAITYAKPIKVGNDVSAIINANSDDSTLSKAERNEAIEKIAMELNSKYVFPKIGKEMAGLVRKNNTAGKYDQFNNAKALSSQLTEDLRAVCKDLHLRVLSNTGLKARKRRRRNLGHNHGFVRAEWLPGKIGYLKLIAFDGSNDAQEVAAAAMKFLEGANAIIFDLRENGGGSPRMIAFLSSYLFDKKVHLNSFYYRPTDTTTKTFTQKKVPGKKVGEKTPVYVLTSSRTFSAAEEFTYNLKHMKRATIVGETTGGGAHPVMFVPVGKKMRMSLPFARAINPITKTNWEGVGVKPHVETEKSKALEKALELARAASHTE